MFSEQGEAMPVRVGVIGIGNIGTSHAQSLAQGQIKGLSLAAVCDNAPSRLEWSGEHFPHVSCFSSWKELLGSKTVDAVVIAVPHPLHGDIAKAALKSGLHVIVEKPVDITVTKAEELNKCAEESGRVFAIMFNQRTNGLYAKAHQLVREGQLGELKRSVWIVTNWYRTQHYYDSGNWRATWAGEGGGVLLNQAPHNLDLWQWICGMPTEITAFCDVAKYHLIEVEDDVTIFARYPNGATGTFLTSTGEYPGTNRLEISGTLGKLVLENGVLKWWKLPIPERELCFQSKESFPQEECPYTEFSSEKDGGHRAILQNFADAIL
ncbi:MAG: Gfo/Idh/MocA family oxidoreductase, partial [Acetatifactor sp.]|nr:Gfo/Idh/MocA family oxidoreductase [Acetatifactor sp.]